MAGLARKSVLGDGRELAVFDRAQGLVVEQVGAGGAGQLDAADTAIALNQNFQLHCALGVGEAGLAAGRVAFDAVQMLQGLGHIHIGGRHLGRCRNGGRC